MGRIFNVSAACKPELHYMVNMDEQLKQIKAMVDQGLYFTINRARQYGKTTTLHALERLLQREYIVISLDFQMFSAADFETEKDFIENFCMEILGCAAAKDISADIRGQMEGLADGSVQNDRLSALFRCLSKWCRLSEKKIVLMIDEADSASEYRVFLDFLAQLRGYYIIREKKPIFQSVILAGVYDIKNLKNKFVEEYRMNSPWNVAADFDIDLRLREHGIAGMLADYEEDHQTGMNIQEIAGLIYDYTSGYPFLVSRICKLMDEKVYRDENEFERNKAWTKEGFLTAVRMLLTEENTLFDSLDNKLIDYPDLKQMLMELLLQGNVIEYVPGNLGIRMAAMFGFVTIENYIVNVSNRIFETRLYNGFLAEKSRHNELAQTAALEKNQFIADGRLDMELVLRKFVSYYQDIFGELQEKFLEDNGRCLFLLYIKPIINGTGNYYIEAKTRTNRRTDLIIDYCGEQHIVELKLWRGQEYNKRGEEQLTDYLDLYHAKQGYLVSFNFNKKKKVGVERLRIKDKIIFEAVV
ncbi:ATP-binding protein [Schaedlerella arabinosiphila]|uniref:ATP-binding protein n=1 Tax=Schaedlerella arabinosiphila TaxID=2044587 RepID=A0A426DC94_9FIRM|nr:AAA-like domain-containing protein [Schaedlerella arabinosiphila]RRK30381.1 ATP-binding protein [Schaedlerella arabinosiphila]